MIITSVFFKEKVALIRISLKKSINKTDWETSIKRIEDVKAQYPQHEFYYSFHLEALVYPYQQKHFANLIGKGVLLIEQLTQKSLKYLSDLTASLHPEATVLLQPEALNLGTAIWIELAKNTRLQLANIIFCKPLDKDARLKTIRELLSYIPYAAYLQISSDCSEIMFEAQLSNISQGKRVLLPSKLTPEQCGWLGKYALPGARIYFPSDIETETAVNVLKALKKNQYVILHPDTPARLIYQLLSALTPNERGYTFEFDFPREGLYPSRVDDSSGSTIASSASLSMDRLLKLDDSIRIPQDINPDLLARLLEDSEIIFKTHLSTLTSEKEVRLPSKLTPKQCRWLGEWALPDTSIYFPSNIETETAVNALKALKKNQYVILHPDTPARLIYQLLSALTPNERGCSLEFDFPREGLYPSRVDDSSGSTIASSTSLSMNRLLRPYDCISIRENLNSDLFNQFLKNEVSSINILFHKNADPQNAVQIVAKIQDNPFTKTLFLSPYLSKTWINEFIKGISDSKLRCKISIMAGYNDDWLSYTVSRIPAGCQFYLPWNISISHAKIVLQCLVGKDVGFEMPPHTLPETRKFITPCLQFNNHIPAPDNINPVEQNKVSNTPTPPSTKHEESPDVELFAAETPNNVDLLVELFRAEYRLLDIETPTLDIVDSFFDKMPLPVSDLAPLLPSAAPLALVPQTQGPSLPSHDTLTLSDSLWLDLTERPPMTEAPAHSSPPANVRLTSHMFSRAPKVSQEETEANEKFKALIERQGVKSIIRMPATFPFPFPSPRFIENTLKRSKGIIKLHPKTDVALATWIASALPPSIALMLPPELIAVPETAKAIVDVLKPECTLYVDAFSPKLPEAIQILPPKVTLLLNMNKLRLPEATPLVSALPTACNLALAISRTNFIQLKDSLPKLINGLKAGCTLKVDMTWEVEYVRWLASKLSPGIGLFVPPSRRSTEDPSSLSPTKVEAITSKLIPGTLVATQAKPDATVHGNTSPYYGFFSSRPTSKRSACEPMPASAISDSPPLTFSSAQSSSEKESLRLAKALSLATIQSSPTSAPLWQQIGPRELPTMGTLVDVPDDGDCFFHAILHQSKRPEVAAILGGSELTVASLRQQIPGISTEPGTWADHDDIHRFVACYSACILAVIDTRTPERGFISYYQGVDNEVITNSGVLGPLPERPIIYIAHNGNHFLSVTQFKAIANGTIQNGFDHSACFLSDDEEDCSSEELNDHSNMKRQRT